MENTRLRSLFVLTLLQLCRAEISDNAPESWYSANVINDGFQPKSISEIFTTDHPFSSTNPIIVLPKSSVPDKILSSTLAPPSSDYEEFSRASPTPSSTPLPPFDSTVLPQLSTDFPSRFPSQPPNVEITQFTEQTLPPSESLLKTQSNFQPTSQSSSLPPSTIELQSTQTPPYSPASSQFLIPPQNVPAYMSTQNPLAAPTPGPLSNYFLIYQQAPQNIQSNSGQPSLHGGLLETSVLPQSSTTRLPGSTVIIQPPTTVSPINTRITSNNPISSTSISSSKRPSRMPSSQGVLTSRTPTTQLVQSPRPCQNRTQLSKIGTFPVRIRVIGPRGSITHVNINPRISSPLSTTTRRPTTTKTRKTQKPKRNTYDACLGGCKARREPICAIPLSSTWIDPEQLKGFPSICHMACFNSYKKEPYEKLLDGRCGRLRTRIETFDSKTKLKREELNKAQYIIDDGDKTIVEVSSLA